jgi:Transposase DDE domain group 1
MPTECSADLFEFASVEGRKVVAAFDAGPFTSDAGALLLGATDRAIGMMKRFACCFDDLRRPDLIEHEVVTLVGQRVFGIALGYEDLNDHDELRDDPIMAVLAGKLEARREDCAPVAGKSTLNRLELSELEPQSWDTFCDARGRAVRAACGGERVWRRRRERPCGDRGVHSAGGDGSFPRNWTGDRRGDRRAFGQE